VTPADRPNAARAAYPWREFVILVIAGAIAAVLAIPYMFALLPPPSDVPLPPPIFLVVNALIGNVSQMAIAVGIGLLAARAVGLRAPVTEALATRGDVRQALRQIDALRAVLFGVGASVFVIVLSVTVFAAVTASLVPAARAPGRVFGFLASFEGGITEEILLRLFVMSVIAWLLSLVWRDRPPAMFWTANIASALLFGIGHLPATAALIPLTPIVVARAIVLNGLLGLVAGWLYWRRGLESAMVAHFSADIVLHVIVGG
jgi:Type II CAAX prenyl endopeptidase Rce1-like